MSMRLPARMYSRARSNAPAGVGRGWTPVDAVYATMGAARSHLLVLEE